MTWLGSKIPRLIHSIHAEGPHAGAKGTHHHLVIWSVDTPEVDSYIKQLAAHIGGLTNHPSTLVSKEGQAGMQPWHINNKMHDGGPAHPHAMLGQ